MRGSSFLKSLGLACWATTSYLTTPALANDIVARQSTSQANSSATWIYQNPSDPDYSGASVVVTITTNPANDDLWFRMSAPAQYSWLGLGAGSSMSDAKAFFIAYEGSRDNSVVVSTRGGCDDCEPGALADNFGTVYTNVVPGGDAYGNVILNGTMYVAGYIKNGTRRAGIDPTKKDQSFMWAVGPQYYMPRSDALDAPLRMHTIRGTFQLDMTKAYGTSMPALGSSSTGVAAQGNGATRDHEWSSSAHAVAMLVPFVILYPLAILMLRVFNRVKLHMIMASVALVPVTVGWIIGFIISRRYQRSMSFTSPHQILGIIIYILLLLQWTLGLLSHLHYKKTSTPHFLIKPHKYGLGPITLSLAIINIALGFRLALNFHANTIYIPAVIAILVLLIIASLMRNWLHGRRKNKSQMTPGPGSGPVFQGSLAPAPQGWRAPSGSQVPVPERPGGAYGGGYWGAQGGGQSDVELNKMNGPPPAYGGGPAQPRGFV